MLIPLVGNFLAYIPAGAGGADRSDQPRWWLVLIVMFIMQSLMMQVVGPRIMSSAVGIHPVFTVMAMLLGAQVMGVWGALFGIPVAGVIGLVASIVLQPAEDLLQCAGDDPFWGWSSRRGRPPSRRTPLPSSAAIQPATAAATPRPVPRWCRPPGPQLCVRGLTWLAATASRRGSKR